MAQDNPFPNLGGLTYSEDVFYRIIDELFSPGVVGPTDYQVVQNPGGANMSVSVQPGSAYVPVTNGGKRRTRLPAISNSGTPGSPNAADKWLTTFVAADATNPRIDRVVLTVRDTSIDGSGASDSALRVIAGTPTAGATLGNANGAAAIPANSIHLANVLVPNSSTSVITANIANVATSTGATMRGRTTTGPLSGGPPLNPQDGDIWIATGIDATYGGRWQFQYNAASGSTYKWELIGGAPWTTGPVNPGTIINLNSAVNPPNWYAPSGTTYTAVRSGEYLIDGGLTFQANGATDTFNQVAPFQGTTIGAVADVPPSWSVDTSNFARPILYSTPVNAGLPMGLVGATGNSGTVKYGLCTVTVIPKRVS